ncbi:alanine racemase, partial [Staphylococcus aureus]|uniref:alanine racemase C-terminal domain-containing protein n=1 Tax=Staphylococcus aureus TaxID=1280 RepID=UPI00065B4D73
CDFCNAIRLGISLYGDYSSEYVQQNVKEHRNPSVELIANVVQTKSLQAGESVRSGATYTATELTTIALLPVGYAVGYLGIMQG